MEDEHGDVPLLPLFYTGKWPDFPGKQRDDSTLYQRVSLIAKGPKLYHPQFFIFSGSGRLQDRVVTARKYFPFLVYETTIEPGFIDELMHWLNPVNKAERIYIYRNREFYRSKIE
jgi:hypothetical protein